MPTQRQLGAGWRADRRERRARRGGRRRGVVLVLFALMSVMILGFAGLILDTGLLLSVQRQAQNAADAAALAAGHDLYRGRSSTIAANTARTYVRQYNGLPDAAVTVHYPPSSASAYRGHERFIEVVVQVPVRTFLIQILGVDPDQVAAARATGGYEPRAAGEGVMAIDPRAIPGLKLSGNGSLRVAGRVVVNSYGEGVDELGQPVDLNGNGSNNDGVAAVAGKDGDNFGFFADRIDVVGGVDKPAQFKHISRAEGFEDYPAIEGSALNCRQTEEPDPLIELPTPTVALGVDPTRRGSVTVTNNSVNGLNSDEKKQNFRANGGEVVANGLHVAVSGQVILHPGIYESLKINGGNVFFIPGIYVMAPTSNTTSTLEITGGTVLGRGIMIYNTTATYLPFTGLPDSLDRASTTPLPKSDYAGGININSGLTLTPIDTALYNYASLYSGARAVSSDFDGMTFYQRRRNTNSMNIQGNAATGVLEGTFYAKWAQFNISGQGTYDAQFIIGSLDLSGNGIVTIRATGNMRGRANRVFLVE